MNRVYDKLITCLDSIRKVSDFVPRVGIILGSGLGDYADNIKIEQVIDYSSIDGFPISTVKGHKGRFVFGYIDNVPVVIMQGRVHFYEGYSMTDVVLPTRLIAMLGAKTLILTNAAGGVNISYKAGDFMIIKDHISSFVPSPLIGENLEILGTRFPDMSEVYDKNLCKIIKDISFDLDIDIKEGVYLQFTGPAYETPAEIRMARALGADAVGMSTACEAMVAAHAGLRVCAISCITNMAAGILETKLNHSEVQETADRVSKNFKKLLDNLIKRI